MNTHIRYTPLLIVIALLSLASLACRLSEVGTAVPSPAPPTLPPFETYTPIPSPVVIAVNGPVDGPLPNSTESAPPIMTARVDLNVRRGPSTQYPILTALRATEQAEIVGRSPDGFWWKVICPSPYGGECWSSARAEYSTA
ncbi:MAG: SH3 domain-containing protein, partial [Anaerolineae bacterium]|nr:SH3 domain-containing protein [Anaerolineae bacterium]